MPRSKPALMLQGTASGVGKSILTAAFCRIFSNLGLSVAPFKAQNMSLNSYVTANGEEVARSTALQAQAARVDLEAIMNPLLLKPNSDTGSQIVLLGKPHGNMLSNDFLKTKESLRSVILQSYDDLQSKYDLIVLEGAGSPAEINLKKTDMVNMSMAAHAQAKVLLVGDIDKGGLFASYIGHHQVFESWERDLLMGYLINKFRGDASLLNPAIIEMQERTNKPTLGIIPYMHDLFLPEEDGIYNLPSVKNANIQIKIIAYPHMSNFTDFDCFHVENDVSIEFTRNANDLTTADVIVLPGSKNISSDLHWLNSGGMSHRINQLAGKVEIIGICGGMQMLGSDIQDPNRIESNQTSIDGLNLLSISTTMLRAKTTLRREAWHIESKQNVQGYEIHHGISTMKNALALFRDHLELGIRHSNENIWGTYLHGIFDNDTFRNWWLNQIRQRKELPIVNEPSIYNVEPYIERLATIVQNNVELEAMRGHFSSY